MSRKVNGWATVPLGHGCSLADVRGPALEAEARLLSAISGDRAVLW